MHVKSQGQRCGASVGARKHTSMCLWCTLTNKPSGCSEKGVLLMFVFPPFIILEEGRKGDPNLTWPGCILSRMVGFVYEWVHCMHINTVMLLAYLHKCLNVNRSGEQERGA